MNCLNYVSRGYAIDATKRENTLTLLPPLGRRPALEHAWERVAVM